MKLKSSTQERLCFEAVFVGEFGVITTQVLDDQFHFAIRIPEMKALGQAQIQARIAIHLIPFRIPVGFVHQRQQQTSLPPVWERTADK